MILAAAAHAQYYAVSQSTATQRATLGLSGQELIYAPGGRTGNPSIILQGNGGRGTFAQGVTMSSATVLGPESLTGPFSFGGGTFNVQKDALGDIWLTQNAYFDGTNWQRIDVTKYAWGLQMQSSGTLPGEPGYFPATTLWRAVPGANPFGAFADVGGWELSQSWTPYRDSVTGGQTWELDGAGTFPFGRLFHSGSAPDGLVRTGIGRNIYDDFVSRDTTTANVMFAGFVGNSNYQVQFGTAAAGAPLHAYLDVTPSSTTAYGNLSATNGDGGGVALGEYFGPGYGAINLGGNTGSYNFLSGNSSTDNSLYINRPSGGTMHFREAGTDEITLAPGGAVDINSGTLAIDAQSANAGQATCFKTGGVLGYCSTAVNSNGGCTCN
jgi:hypothetical protein